jgi:hypothetical protein
MTPIPRDQLVEELAQVSHTTYMKQKARNEPKIEPADPNAVTDHDRERAEDTVTRLEELGVVSWG